MRTNRKLGIGRCFALLAVLALVGCPHPVPDPNPPHDADAAPHVYPDATPVDACLALALVGCDEGADPDCAAVMTKVVQTKLTPIDVPCLAAAHSKDDVHRCRSNIACR